MIARLVDVTEGEVLIGGVDVRELDPDVLWHRIGLVPQKAYLFAGTVASNVRYGKPDATDKEIWAALEIAQAKDFVQAMGGLDAPIAQGGANVSGGQRQRLAIARALVRRPDVYLFDDSFSALDLATDARLRAALGPHTRKATVVVVAQRVSTIKNADQILVLEEGSTGRSRDAPRAAEDVPDVRGDRRVASRPGDGARVSVDTQRRATAKRAAGEEAAGRRNRSRRRSRHEPPPNTGGPMGRWGSAGMPLEKASDFGSAIRRLWARLRSRALPADRGRHRSRSAA